MMQAEWLMLLVLVGAVSGAVSGLIRCCPTLIAIPALYFFAPVFHLSFSDILLPLVATSIAAFIPTHLYQWVKAMQQNRVDFEQLIRFAPGVAMGGVIGAQLVSLMSLPVFMVCFSTLSLLACINFALRPNTFRFNTAPSLSLAQAKPLLRLPIGLLLGGLSLLCANSGRTLGESLFFLQACSCEKRHGTATGLAVFASIAAVLGFAFPAADFNHHNLTAFAGAIHLPSLIALALSHFTFYWLCKGRGSPLDKCVLTISLAIFLMVSLTRIWLF